LTTEQKKLLAAADANWETFGFTNYSEWLRGRTFLSLIGNGRRAGVQELADELGCSTYAIKVTARRLRQLGLLDSTINHDNGRIGARNEWSVRWQRFRRGDQAGVNSALASTAHDAPKATSPPHSPVKQKSGPKGETKALILAWVPNQGGHKPPAELRAAFQEAHPGVAMPSSNVWRAYVSEARAKASAK
jgi:hypothetical protein